MSYPPPPGPPPHIPYYTAQVPFHNPRPASVTVLAILGIIFGALGVLCMPLMLAAPFIPELGEELGQQYEGAALVGNTVLNVVQLLLSGVLLISSIAALRLHPLGRKGMIWEEAASLLLLPVGVAMFLLWDLEELRGMDEVELVAAAAGGACGVLVTVVYAVLVLYFMTRPEVKAAFGEGPDEPWPPQVPPYQPYQPPR
jgi:hypothetical protein